MNQGGTCNHMHHKCMPMLIVLFGLTFLLGNWGVLSPATVAWVWPTIIVLAGLSKMKRCGCCKMHDHQM